MDEIPRMTTTGPASIEQHAAARIDDMQADLDLLRRELEHTHRLATLGTVAALSAHEINNVLTAALGYAQLARSSGADAGRLEKIIDRLESAARIAAAMLDFAGLGRLGQGRGTPLEAEIGTDVSAVLDSALNCLGRDPARDGIELIRRIDGDALPEIGGLALQQIFLNLLLNARRALRGREGRIIVSTMRIGTGRVRISVADDGPGIPPDIVDSLFEPFVTCDCSGRRDGGDEAVIAGGSGLGLTVCRRLVESAGGTISAGASGSGGAEFILDLPAAAGARRRKAS
jgi:two-component system NtrC family sensor kinase